ncbi:MAG: sigma-54-dependent Fis family transcriptional regulator [Anaerolineales bacterium]|nr:sigma-54-dependent Fis family transcriptional regulator [Anaerolineales bacterium]MCW5856207.1 sigma-54-dependent Fis family transcriptional regulator [Anaerolineales bacterium]
MSLSVLIVDDEKNARENIAAFLSENDYEVSEAEDIKSARKALQEGSADVILLDVELPDGLGTTLLEETSRMPNRPPIIIITAKGEIDMAVEAMKNGAHDFLQKPLKFERLEQTIQRAGQTVAMRRELNHLRQVQKQSDFVLGQSEAMKTLLIQAERVAQTSASVLISGETGTGKEVLAKAIHRMGPRADKPFIDINCAAVPAMTIESELFGHEVGAFTGADKRKQGLMEVANDGVLFLDEISSMPADMQSKLLRALEERSFRRAGGTTLVKVDVQVIAASNRDLPTMMKNNEFRDDLYYRLRVVDMDIPPLRERTVDIPELVGFFIQYNNPRLGRNILDVTPKAIEALMAHPWPGNIRELRNAVERAMIFCDEAAIDVAHLPADITSPKDK